MNNILESYNQLTTTWERIRANLLSHVIVGALLWVIGFAPPSPNITLQDLIVEPGTPLYPVMQNVGVFVWGLICLALVFAAYVIALVEIGHLLSSLFTLFLPTSLIDARLKLMPERALLNIAATLEGGVYQPYDLGRRLSELLTYYWFSNFDEWQKQASGNVTQRDTKTYFQNALIFVIAWILLTIFLPKDSNLGFSIRTVFWRGLFVLGLYLVLSRALLIGALQVMLVRAVHTVSALVENDALYTDRLTAARSNPGPYRELVERYRRDAADTEPSLFAYFRAHLKRLFAHRGRGRPDKQTLIEGLRHFGFDPELNRDYRRPDWLVRYAGWRVVDAFGRLLTQAEVYLVALGLRKP